MMSNASANPGNTSAVSAAATLPAKDPIGSGDIFITSANARELGFIADTAIDTAITASNAVTYEYTGTPSRGATIHGCCGARARRRPGHRLGADGASE